MLNDLLERGAKRCGFDLHWHSDGKLDITQKQLERFAVFVAEDCADNKDAEISRLRGQLQNCVNLLHRLKRHGYASDVVLADAAIESANQALYETLGPNK